VSPIAQIATNFQDMPYGVEYARSELIHKLSEGLTPDMTAEVLAFIVHKRESGELVKVMTGQGDRYYRRGTT